MLLAPPPFGHRKYTARKKRAPPKNAAGSFLRTANNFASHNKRNMSTGRREPQGTSPQINRTSEEAIRLVSSLRSPYIRITPLGRDAPGHKRPGCLGFARGLSSSPSRRHHLSSAPLATTIWSPGERRPSSPRSLPPKQERQCSLLPCCPPYCSSTRCTRVYGRYQATTFLVSPTPVVLYWCSVFWHAGWQCEFVLPSLASDSLRKRRPGDTLLSRSSQVSLDRRTSPTGL